MNTVKYLEMLEKIGKYWQMLGSDKGRAQRAPFTDAGVGERSEPANASPIICTGRTH